MASTKSGFQEIFLTYKDIHEAAKDWPDRLIEDYLSLKRDLELTADTGDEIQAQVDDNKHLISGLIGTTGKQKAVDTDQQSTLNNHIHLLAGLTGDVGKNRATSNKQAGKIIDIFHLLAGLGGSNGKLRALSNLLRRDIKNINQILGGIGGDIGKLNALVYQLIRITRLQDTSVTTTYTQDKYDKGIFCDATSADFTVTMIDPALAFHDRALVKNETGAVSAITIAATVGSIEVTTLNNLEWVVLAPRPDLVTPANSVWAAVG